MRSASSRLAPAFGSRASFDGFGGWDFGRLDFADWDFADWDFADWDFADWDFAAASESFGLVGLKVIGLLFAGDLQREESGARGRSVKSSRR